MPLMNHALIRPLSLALGLFAAAVHGQEERWYQVELMIFSHESGSTPEQWDPLPSLAYPDTGRFLIYPGQLESRQEEHGGVSEVDSLGRQTLRPPAEETTEDRTEDRTEDKAPDIPIAGNPTGNSAPALDAEAVPEEQNLTPLTPTPFIALPRKNAELYDKAAFMQRTGNYKTLFHETWVQPVQGESTAIPLVIDRSGDSGDWPRLQGTVKLHIARYLHLETNLWINTQGQYLPAEWRMPEPPLGPQSLFIEQPEPVLLEETAYPLGNDNPEAAGQQPVLEEKLASEIAPEETGPVYPWRHAVLLQQKRRMRSKEVHYIDHPLIGVVIKFMPLDEEQLQIMADAEFAEETNQAL
mgnify:FL=1